MLKALLELRTVDRIRTILWIVCVLFIISGLVFAYIAILTQDGDVMGGIAALNLSVAGVIALGNGMSYI